MSEANAVQLVEKLGEKASPRPWVARESSIGSGESGSHRVGDTMTFYNSKDRKDTGLASWKVENEANAAYTALAVNKFELVLGALEATLPLHQDGVRCWYCSIGSKPDADKIHFDADNVWDGNQRCLESDYYDDARHALATVAEAAQKALEA